MARRRLGARRRRPNRANARVTYQSLLRTSPNGRFSGLPLGRSQRRMYGLPTADSTTLR
jgi:hypothetical protein